MTDSQLYKLCKKYGSRALEWRRKFVGLLPEVHKRKLYQRRGFTSIFEFAAKLAGVSQEQVRLVLNLEERFQRKPALKNLLISGEVSVNKLTRVASIATLENQDELASKVQTLSNRAVETFVKDFKNENGLNRPKSGSESLHVRTLELAEDVKMELLKLQAKGIDINELLRKTLKVREAELELEEEGLSHQTATSRYIPVKIRKFMEKQYGTKCAVPSCLRPSQTLHHTARYSLTKTHDPHFLAPLCQQHHEIAHAVDLKIHSKKTEALRL